jgi:hypothetical protein
MYSTIFGVFDGSNKFSHRIWKMHKIFSLGRFKGDFDIFGGAIEDELMVQLRFVGIK